MKPALALIALALAMPLASPVSGTPSGEIGTLPAGTYRCELPGDALGPIGRPQVEDDFTVVTASTYRAGGRLGSYLLVGKHLVMTTGPFKGRRYHVLSPYFLRLILPDGHDGPLRCVRPRGIDR